MLRVMSFNLRFDTPADGADAWAHRRDLAAATIRRLDPDVVGTQEALPHQLEDLRRALPDYQVLGRDRGGESPEHAAVLVRRARFTVQAHGTRWLSATPEVPGSRSWGSACPRVMTWVELAAADGSGPVLVVNTHLDHAAAAARLEQARLLAAWVAARTSGAPCVMTGDFNAAPGGAEHRLLTGEHGLQDAWEVAATREGPEGTFHGFTGCAPGERRIDWVLVDPRWRILACRVDDSAAGERYPSDHFPVVAELAPTGGRGQPSVNSLITV